MSYARDILFETFGAEKELVDVTVIKISETLNVSKPTIYKLIKGNYSPPIRLVKKINQVIPNWDWNKYFS